MKPESSDIPTLLESLVKKWENIKKGGSDRQSLPNG